MILINNWSIVSTPNNDLKRLRGDVVGHPRLGTMAGVVTTAIKLVCGKTVYTCSGSIYTLGNPSNDYIEFCKTAGGHIPTEDLPILMKDKVDDDK